VRFKFSLDVDLRKLEQAADNAKKALERGMNDIVDDLVRTSSETAPHYKGTLEKSWSRDVTWKGNRIEGEVTYSVKEDDFNYALWTHEADYNLGEGSLAKPGGTGMSGTSYPVGNKYLTRPLEGEAKTYKAHIAKEIEKELR
jgi:hypothetical protein